MLSCKKEKKNATTEYDVYTVGYRKIDDGETYATLWKNNEETKLTPLVQYAEATCITSESNDIYVGGFSLNTSDDEFVAKYWKNGVETILTDGTHSAVVSSIAVSNGDVYCGGYEWSINGNKIAKYWKNGVATTLTIDNNDGEVKDIKIYNGDVYCVGYKINSGDIQEARLWINGTSTLLTKYASATSIIINGDDIYIGGFMESDGLKATYWKNGVPTILTTNSGAITDLFLDKSTLYFSGNEAIGGYLIAKLWKDEVETVLSPEGETNEANDIFVADNNVYVSGYINGNYAFWKNGIKTKTIEDFSGCRVFDILVQKK
jgi:hypothetical protein